MLEETSLKAKFKAEFCKLGYRTANQSASCDRVVHFVLLSFRMEHVLNILEKNVTCLWEQMNRFTLHFGFISVHDLMTLNLAA
jgi:hypothetical protein